MVELHVKSVESSPNITEVFAFVADEEFYIVSDQLDNGLIAVVNLSDDTHEGYTVKTSWTLDEFCKNRGITTLNRIFTKHDQFYLAVHENK